MFGSLFRAFHFLTDRIVSLASTLEEAERVLTGQIDEANSRLRQLPPAASEESAVNGVGRKHKTKVGGSL